MIGTEKFDNNYFSPRPALEMDPEFTTTRTGHGIRPHVESITVVIAGYHPARRHPRREYIDGPELFYCRTHRCLSHRCACGGYPLFKDGRTDDALCSIS
jgi:hypothetical protein